DLLVPKTQAVSDRNKLVASLRAQIPQEHIDFVTGLMAKYDIPSLPPHESKVENVGTDPSVVDRLLEVCFSHNIKLIANALGTPPREMVERANSSGVPVAALVG